MGRDDRQDINKILKSGSDLPARDKDMKDEKNKTKSSDRDDESRIQNTRGYKGSHRKK